MAVPRKRKKLAEKSESPAKRVRSSAKKPKQASKKRTVVKASSKKIDDAFKIMTHIEDKKKKIVKTPKVRTPVEQKEPPSPKPSSNRFGFRFQVSLDALMPNKARRDAETRKQPVKESTVIDIDLTIPFLWDIPIIGGLTQKFFKNFKTIKL